MLAESEGSDHLDFHEHSKGELQYFQSSITNVQCRFSLCPHPRLCLLGILEFSCGLSFLESSISLSACITMGMSHCSQKSYHTVKPCYQMTVFCSLCSFSMEWRLEAKESDFSRFRVVFFVIIQHGGCITKWKFCNSSVLHKYRTFHTYEKNLDVESKQTQNRRW